MRLKLTPSSLLATILLLLLLTFNPSFAQEDNTYRDCVLIQVERNEEKTAEQITKECYQETTNEILGTQHIGSISRRIISERRTQWNPFVITPHRRNYILPFYHTNKYNREAYSFADDRAVEGKAYETKFQLSIKIPFNSEDLVLPNDALYFGFTMQSWWQVFATNISSPFRESNYQPELFYLAPLNWHPAGSNTGFLVGFEHQSNGKPQILSRSWNRLYAGLMLERHNFAFSGRAWYRIPEDERDDPDAPDGDDNPDIEAYMGNFELSLAYSENQYAYSLLLRNNLRSNNRGAAEFGFSFPLVGHLKGLFLYFNGYGESLIDYNQHMERVGIGILLTDIL